LDDLFASFPTFKIGIIGDVMLDTYWWGKVDRISPEAPVPVVAVSSREQRIGGAGNVALNLASLGAKAAVITLIGDDGEGKQLKELLENQSIDTSYIQAIASRPTTNKIRIISRNQHMMRLDAEEVRDISPGEEQALLGNFQRYLQSEKPALVILEDYNKGILTSHVITEVIRMCKAANVLTAVDPKRKNFFEFEGVDLFKPNLKEAKEGLNLVTEELNLELLRKIHAALAAHLHHGTSLITLSEKGVFYENKHDHALIPTHIRSIADVSGAGDTVIAVASLVYAATKDIAMAAEMANIAGGLVCEEVGTVAIDKNKLLEEARYLL
jgi:rfaE bifunctional protein kinase chain/domain